MDNNTSGYASGLPQSMPLPSSRRPGGQAAPPLPRRHAFRRLQSHQHMLPLLIATTALTLLVVIAIGYVAARASAISAAEASVSVNAQIAREVIGERGQYPAIVNNQLVASNGASSYTLVNDTWVVDHTRQLTGDWVVIYQLNNASAQPSLVAVAANLPQTDGQGHPLANTRATSQPMPADAQAAIFGSCGLGASASPCIGDYKGVVSVAGASYVAGFAPLLSQDGRLVGAVGVMEPLDTVLAAPLQLVILLLLVGLLAGLIVLVVGMWLSGRFPNRLLRQLDSQLDIMARAAVELGRLAQQQQLRLRYQQRAARQVGDHALKLEELASAMDNGQEALRQTTTAIWAEMSQPGAAINPAMALRLAQQAAVRASEVGTAGDATRAHARQVITLMNQVIAEGRALAHEGEAAETHANELAATLDRMETDLGEQFAPRRYDLGSAPLMRRISAASHRLLQLLQSSDDGSPESPRERPAARPSHPSHYTGYTSGPWGASGPRRPGAAPHGGSGRPPSVPFRGNEPFNGFPGRSQPGAWPPAGPGASGSRKGDGRPGGDFPAPPGRLPPLGRFDDDPPLRGPNDSHWLND